LRTIRLLILLLAVALAVGLALMRPLQGRATRPGKRARAHHVRAHHLHQLRAHHLRRFHRAKAQHRRTRHIAHLDPARLFGHRVVSYARHFLGTPYSWGGASPGTGFDCSGFVRYVYSHFGIALPHSSFADLGHGRRVGRRWLRPGDLVFFYGASHVGIYVGDDRFIDAPHTGSVVRISTMGAYAGYYGARRFR
jgi:cell wall-associated NlpC family hydrolase